MWEEGREVAWISTMERSALYITAWLALLLQSAQAQCCNTSGMCGDDATCRGPGRYAVFPDAEWVSPPSLFAPCQACCKSTTTTCTGGGTCVGRTQCPFRVTYGNACPFVPQSSGLACCPSSGEASLFWNHSQALSYLRSQLFQVAIQSQNNCSCARPGCTSLDGIRRRTLDVLVSIFPKWSLCTVVLVGGVYDRNDTSLESHANGYVVDVAANTCIDRVVRSGTPRSGSELALDEGCSEAYDHGSNATFCRRPGNAAVWTMIAHDSKVATFDATRLAHKCTDADALYVCIDVVSSIVKADGSLLFADDLGFMKRMANACPSCVPGEPLGLTSGGPFHVTSSQFLSVQRVVCTAAESAVLLAIQKVLG